MSRLFRRIGLLLIAALALLLAAASALLLRGGAASAEEQEPYYYSQLTAEAKRFYNAIGDMAEQGLLKQGNAEYDLVENGTLTQEQLSSYARQADVMVAFGAGRDAYYLDHPELFYIDFSYLSVSVGTKNGAYVATLGTGRAETYYIGNGFTSVSETEEAIAAVNERVSQYVAVANNAGTAAEKVKAVNARLIENVTYSFCSSADANGTTYEDGAAHIRNVYGALVNGKCVCEGYARAFKLIMDELGIPCLLVQGYAQGTGGGFEPHMWNYVNLDGSWYGVDVTWNDTDGKNGEVYLLRGYELMNADHITDGVISEGGFQFRYPVLSMNDYGVSSESGLTVESVYNDEKTSVHFQVSAEGKNAEQLAQEGKYTAYRVFNQSSGWTVWMYIRAEDFPYNDRDGYTEFYGANSYVQYIQFAVIDYAPDYNTAGGSAKFAYDPDVLTERHFVMLGDPIANQTYGSYAAPPYIKQATPASASPISAGTTYHVTVVYTEALKLADNTASADITFVGQHGDVTEYASVSDFVWNESQPDTVSFRFAPSRMFQHRIEVYTFYLVNLIGAESEAAPAALSYITEEPNVVCNKIYGDGRLYIKAYGEPSFVGTGDLSLKGWQYEDGTYVAENQRSQLMLVASKPSAGQSADMLESAAESAGVSADKILASDTFEIDLSICGNIVTIPDGSYMQVAFGFPEGYGPDDAGVTFKVYHYKRGADGAIDYSLTEELDCVVTEYGIVVTVTSFSPFAVVAFPADKVSSSGRAVYARTVGFGGSMTESGISVLKQGESGVNYAFTPDAGYRLDRVLLNGETVSTNNNGLTLNYGDLQANNTLEVYFVADRVADREAQEGVAVVYPSLNVVRDQAADSPALTPTEPSGSGGAPSYLVPLVVGICIAVVAVATVAVVLVVVKRRKR